MIMVRKSLDSYLDKRDLRSKTFMFNGFFGEFNCF